MSTSELFLTEEEIQSFLAEYQKDSDYIYGYKEQEFGISPYITFYMLHDETEVESIINKIIDIYQDFEVNFIDKPFKLTYERQNGIWVKPEAKSKSKQEILADYKNSFKNSLFSFGGATSGDSNIQTAKWAYSLMISEANTYSYFKITFGEKWYRLHRRKWNLFVENCLLLLNPIQAYSGYEIGNTAQLSIISPEFETVEKAFADLFYGLDIDHPSSMAFHSHFEENYVDRQVLGAGLRTPTWCFLLSPYWLEKLGLNEVQIREKLNDSRIEITKILDQKQPDKYSLWIQLGDLSLYPVENGVPELLVMANELTKPIRCNYLKLTTLDAWDDDPNPRFDELSSKQWIARFDEDSTWPELRRVEVEVQEPERIDIVRAGEPCPHAGHWYTFAKENSRQYFKQGDIFPDFESDWGDVYWQFDGEE